MIKIKIKNIFSKNLANLSWRKFLIIISASSLLYLIIFEHNSILTLRGFIRGHASEQTTLMEKIMNDLDIKPYRNITNYKNKSDLNYKDLDNLPLNLRRAKPKMFLSDMAPQGYRVIYGVFDFLENLHGAILLNPAGKVVNIWPVSQKELEGYHQKDTNIFPHGFEIFSDGSIITAFGTGGSALTKYNYCGDIVWQLYGHFHHAISYDGENSIWVLGDVWDNTENDTLKHTNFLKIDIATGEVLKESNFEEIEANNPKIDIFGIVKFDSSAVSKWITTPEVVNFYWHPNDIESLPKILEEFYPNFKAGDLLMSLRNPNLILVIDQDTLEVKWWRQGLTRRQHDPDWNTRGTITVYNNNMHRGYSSIVEMDPVTHEHSTLIEGEEYNFTSWLKGKHDALPNKGYLITSSQQGRVFEVDENGDVTFEFLNIYNQKENEYLILSEARFLPVDFFENLPICNLN